MLWFELILLLLIGTLFVLLGWLIWKKEKIGLIHDYHYKKVKEEDKKSYTEKMGKALIVIGMGSVLTGIVDFVIGASYGWWIFGICFCISLAVMIYAQIKYNHGIF